MADFPDLTHLAPALARRLKEAGLTTDGVAAALGPDYTEALYRGEPHAVRHQLASLPQPLAGLIALLLLRDSFPREAIEELLGASLASELIAGGYFATDEDGYFLDIDVRPHSIAGHDFWVFSDADAAMREIIPGPEHVMGVGAASLSLLQAVPQTPVDSVLDLGTGSGVQVLGQLGVAREILATDVHPRAVELARGTIAAAQATFDGIPAQVSVAQGAWFEPAAGRRFDRIVANPPFVVGPPIIEHVYRDSGLNLDEATALVAGQAADFLAPGGTAFLLGSWVHTGKVSWQRRVASWLPEHGVAAWVLERDVADPALYVGTWLADESLDLRSAAARRRTEAWLGAFDAAGVTGVGFGFIALRRIGDEEPTEVVAEELRQPFDDPLGPEIEEYFTRLAWLRERDTEEILAATYQIRPTVAREQVDLPDQVTGMGFRPAALRLTRTDGPRFSHDIDHHVGAIVAGLHPDGLSLEETTRLYCAAQDIDADSVLPEVAAIVTDLVRHGLVLPRQENTEEEE